MPGTRKKRPAWIGFAVGLLLIALPVTVVLLARSHRPRPATPAQGTAPPQAAARGPSAPGPAERIRPGPAEEPGLEVSGASVADPTPPPGAQALERACARARSWLTTFTVDPFGGSGPDSLRLFALEVECWDRLASAAPAGAERDTLAAEVERRLRRVLDAPALRTRIDPSAPGQGMLEMLMLAARCRAYGLDPRPLLGVLETARPSLDAAIERSPASIAALYAASMARIGLAPPPGAEIVPPAGIIAAHPREVTMGANELAWLAAEIFARTDAGRVPLAGLSPEDRSWLHRVLPYFALAMTLLRRTETVGDMSSCLVAAGMTETYGYREALRRLVDRQNQDGSFGDAAATSGRARVIELLAPTTAAVTALSLERQRIGGAR